MITVRFLKNNVSRDIRWGVMDGDMTVIREAVSSGLYEDAAVVATDDLEHAWELVQNGVRTPSWTLEPPTGLTPILPPIVDNGQTYGNRSAMVGDVFVMEDGTTHVCANFGFRVLT